MLLIGGFVAEGYPNGSCSLWAWDDRSLWLRCLKWKFRLYMRVCVSKTIRCYHPMPVRPTRYAVQKSLEESCWSLFETNRNYLCASLKGVSGDVTQWLLNNFGFVYSAFYLSTR
jgi:hypothetical protein